jgi:hypothetical protein
LDPETVERVEAELDAFVNKRAREAKDAEKVREFWAESERWEREKRRQQNGWGWIRHFEGLARAHRALALENDNKVARMQALLGGHGEKEEPMNEKNGHAGEAAS